MKLLGLRRDRTCCFLNFSDVGRRLSLYCERLCSRGFAELGGMLGYLVYIILEVNFSFDLLWTLEGDDDGDEFVYTAG